MSGALDFCGAFDTCPATLEGDKVGVGGGESSRRLGQYAILRKHLLSTRYRLHVFFRTEHFACLLRQLFVPQDLFGDHDVLCRVGFGPPRL